MKKIMQQGLASIMLSAACTILLSMPAFAAEVKGNLEQVTSNQISGWVYDKTSPEEALEVSLYYYADGSETATKFATVTADQNRSDLEQQLGTGNYGFTCSVEWDQFQGNEFTVEACVESDGKKERISEPLKYSKQSVEVSSVQEYGPGMSKEAPATEPETEALPVDAGVSGTRGESLGTFKTTAYCSCSRCSSGTNRTYSGTIPKPNHTISADINVFPMGTKLMIGDIVYTVEDIGSGVNGNKLDIFFSSHQTALNYGVKYVEVFSVN